MRVGPDERMELDRVHWDCAVVDWGWVMGDTDILEKSDTDYAYVHMCEARIDSLEAEVAALEEKLDMAREAHQYATGEIDCLLEWNGELISLVGGDAGERPEVTHERVVELMEVRHEKAQCPACMVPLSIAIHPHTYTLSSDVRDKKVE